MKVRRRKAAPAQRVVILGAGQVGSYISQSLSQSGYNILLIDESEEKIAEAREQADVETLIGHGTDADIYIKAHLNHEDLFVAVTDSDEINLVACRMAKAFGCKTKIARVRQAFYRAFDNSPIDESFWRHLGVEVLFNQEQLTTLEIERLIENPGAIDTVSLHNDRVKIVGYRVREDSLLAGRRLVGLKDLPRFENLLVAAITTSLPVKKNGGQSAKSLHRSLRKGPHANIKEETIIPHGEYKIKEGDLLYISGTPDDFAGVGELFAPGSSKKFKHLFILGGSLLAYQLADSLAKRYPRKPIYLVERNKADAFAARDRTHKRVNILLTDIRNIEDLKNEGLSDDSIFIGASRDEDDNVVASLLIKEETQARTIALIQNPTYIHLLPYLDIDAAVSPKLLLVDEVLKSLRKHEYDVLSAKSTDAEVMEFVIDGEKELSFKQLEDCKFPKAAIAVAVIREEQIIIPRGQTQLRPDDHVVVFALKSAIEDVHKLFKQ